MWMQEVWEPLWTLGCLDMNKEACTCSTWEVTNAFRFVSFSETLGFTRTQKKKADGVAEDQCKQIAEGPAAADEIQTRNKKYDTKRKCLFLPQ